MVEATVVGVYRHQEEGLPPQHFFLLRNKAGQRVPVWVGHFEAWAISAALEGESPDRPMTHDLMTTILHETGAGLVATQIHALDGESYYARIQLRVGDTVRDIDARPSDAVALALRCGAPITVADDIWRQAIPDAAGAA